MTLKVISQLQAFSSAIRRTFVQVPQRQPGFLSSSVKLHGRRTISGKLLAFGFVATIRLLPNYFDLYVVLFSSSLFLLWVHRPWCYDNDYTNRL